MSQKVFRPGIFGLSHTWPDDLQPYAVTMDDAPIYAPPAPEGIECDYWHHTEFRVYDAR